MHTRFLSWLMPIFVLLALVAGSSSASAHAGHVHSGPSTSTGHATGIDIASVYSAKAVMLSATGEPCNCPGGHCNCSIDCLAFCSATVAIVDHADFRLSPVRLIFEATRAETGADWAPGGDLDPPRPIS